MPGSWNFWGYGYYLLFVVLAAVGASLEVAVEAVSHHLDASDLRISYALAAPVAIVLVVIFVVHLPFSRLATTPSWVLPPAAAAVLLLPLAVDAVGLPTVVASIALIVAAVVAVTTLNRRASQFDW